MKNRSVLSVVLAISALLILSACSKNNDAIPGTASRTAPAKPDLVETADTIAYSFSPIDSNQIIRIFYTDTLRNTVSVTEFSQLDSWSVSFPVTSKPFNAAISAQVINRTGKSSDYSVTITLNGIIKTVVPLHVGIQFQPYTARAEYMVP